MNNSPVQLLLLTLLPLQLLSLASRLLHKPLAQRFNAARSALLLVSIPILLSAIFAFPNAEPSKDVAFSSELEKLKLKIDHLESILQENARILNTKTHHLDEEKMLAEALELKINSLERSLDSLKVRLLWAESRGNNFDIHMLESKVIDAVKNLEAVASAVDKLDNLVTEQWIQIQQLEQALQMAKINVAKVHKKSASKFQIKGKNIKDKISEGIFYPFQEVVGLPDSFWLGNPVSSSLISQLLDLVRRIMSTTKNFHYELQYFVKHVMETNDFTVSFANREVIFFLASAIFILPLINAWVFFWSLLRQSW
ncbi:uncharacterized protein LOC120281611 isoform X2 [Dioscorea cayenensis subsp. rotundata]|uniref:Uncharacterized protein LOC120281611 isoform X2 n=1 Tax=Dioscorea cayennensis subsp. rotundata TaxID=55577 RepID=A0AB40CW92_DIOCR|nr:uncharacterized protein LOC120281611 isoform X2 [Dioscorea cayenensis subsp. rotundata]